MTLFVGIYVPPPDVTHADARPTRRPAAASVSARVRVAVLAGGRSSEHEISLASARSVVAALDPERYEAPTIEIGRDGALGAPAARRRSWLTVPERRRRESLPVPTATAPAALGAVDVVLPDPARARSARTGRCRACSSSPACRTSAPA